MSTARPYDLVLFGATGFTGGLIAHYLGKRLAESPRRWALAGRSREKLSRVRRELEREDDRLASLGLIEASSDDPESLRAMARQTKVIMTTVGPYARHGEPLVAACIDEGTHYLDLTGEPAWWKQMIERYHARAEARGVMIIPCCGFDSIPADLGALFTALLLPADQPMQIDGYFSAKGDPSGGTWASLVDAVSAMGSDQFRSEARGRGGSAGGEGPKVHFVEALRRWAVPAPIIDPLVVQRSASLRGQAYGGGLRYHHYLAVKNRLQIAGLMAFLGGLFLATRTGPTRKLVASFRTQGQGPSPAVRAKSWFRVDFIGHGGGREVRAHVSGGDPGYDETSKMMSEAAITLLEESDKGTLPLRGGVLTPASALGVPLIERLRAAGIEFAED